MNSLRWGLLSTARINRRVIPAIRASKRGQLVAVASRDIKKAEQYAAEWEIPVAFGSYEEMLASDQVDIIYISLPNHMHAEWSVKALEAGKHVLCEKPFALSVEEVDRMIDASRRTGRVLAEGFMYLHHPQTKLVGEYVHSGRLGDITLVRAMFSFILGNRSTNIRLNPGFGGGSLWDAGIYPISYAQYIMKDLPHSVAGQQWLGETGVEENFFGQLNYADGRVAQIASSFRIPYQSALEIYGTKGRLTLNRPFNGINEKDRAILFTPADGKTEKLRVKSPDLYLGEIEDLHSAVLDGKPVSIPLDVCRDHVKIACALYEAAEKNQTMPLEQP